MEENTIKEAVAPVNKNITPKKLINRSSAYPAVSLDEAIELVGMLRNQLGKGPYDRESAAKAIGYKGVNGASAQKIAALAHFGLLTRSGNAYSQSVLADSILLSTSEQERKNSIIQASKTPKLYKLLIEKFSGSALPGLLVNILIREYKISEKVADQVAKDFKKSIEFSGLLQNGIVTQNNGENEILTQDEFSEEYQEEQRLPQQERKEYNVASGLSKKNYPIDLPSGIAISFPTEMSYEVIIGEFGEQIKQLESKAQEILSKKQSTAELNSDTTNDSGGLA
ncbi:hypothetical protein HYU45_01495 [Candidatus Daviesbacteria bacterium]|nr:hypothetical protein [Candidatus Daviesbacteria bacterium]